MTIYLQGAAKKTRALPISDAEWHARVQLAACYRIFDHLGWTEMIYNHITVRLPDSVSGPAKQFLINPFGLHYSEVTASNLLKIDVKGNKLDENPWPVNPAGFTGTGDLYQYASVSVFYNDSNTNVQVGITAIPEPSTLVLGGLALLGFAGAGLRRRRLAKQQA